MPRDDAEKPYLTYSPRHKSHELGSAVPLQTQNLGRDSHVLQIPGLSISLPPEQQRVESFGGGTGRAEQMENGMRWCLIELEPVTSPADQHAMISMLLSS